jgi:16S rRNA (cytosine1402-N4)-methyltransferase
VSEARLEHRPVLVEALRRLLELAPGQVVLDGTVGLGGHAAALLPGIQPGGRYIGLDVDEQILEEARRRLSGPGLELICANYAEFPEVLRARGLQRVDAFFLDLGVNSAQIADPARGFSFERDGPLDMRYDRRQQRSAVDLVNALSENELVDLFYRYGQESLSRKIARRICQLRHEGRITTTRALAQAVAAVYAAAGRQSRIHPATRVFQALRIAVNDELGNLSRFLERVPEFLAPGGKLAVISFHSLEDRIVKEFLRRHRDELEELTRRPVVADQAERQANPRARSAKLRVARRRSSRQ